MAGKMAMRVVAAWDCRLVDWKGNWLVVDSVCIQVVQWVGSMADCLER